MDRLTFCYVGCLTEREISRLIIREMIWKVTGQMIELSDAACIDWLFDRLHMWRHRATAARNGGAMEGDVIYIGH